MQQLDLQVKQLETALSQVSKLRAADTHLYDAICTTTLSADQLCQEIDSAAAASDQALASLDGLWPAVQSLLGQAAAHSSRADAPDEPADKQQRKAEQLQRSRMHTRACTALTALESQLIGNGYGTGRHMSEPAAIVDDDSMQDPPSGAQLLQELVDRVLRSTGMGIEYSTGAPNPAALLVKPGAAGFRTTPAAAAATQLVLHCPEAWTTRIALAGPGVPEAIHTGIVSASEEAGSSPCDAFTRSNMVVFRRVSSLAVRALAFFTHRAQLAGMPHASACALEDLLLWLTTYRDLFSKACAATGLLLAPEPATQQLLPPVLRPFRMSRAELQACAAIGSGPPVYHIQDAPADML